MPIKKLKALKALLKAWNRDVFGNVEATKADALNQIVVWDVEENIRSLSLGEVEVTEKVREHKNGYF